jgi:cytochrome P450
MTEPVGYEEHWDRTDAFQPPALFQRLRNGQPLVRMVYPDGHVGWLATGREVVREVLNNPAFSHNFHTTHFPVTKRGKLFPAVPTMPGMFIHMDPPEHTHLRSLVGGEFTRSRLAALSELIDGFAENQVTDFREQGAPGDLLPGYVRPLVLRTLCEVTGIPYAGCERITQLSDTANDDHIAAEVEMAAGREAFLHTRDLVRAAREVPGDNMLGRLVLVEELTDQQITNMLLLVFVAGFAASEGALAMALLALLHHRDALEQFRNTADLDPMVDEVLRFTTVNQTQTFRTALEDVTLDGHLVREGDAVTVSLPAANRDPEKFPRPDELDLTRDAGGHLAFGHGPHVCLGGRLARTLLGTGMSTLFRGLPDIELDVPLEKVPLRARSSVLSVHELPVRW